MRKTHIDDVLALIAILIVWASTRWDEADLNAVDITSRPIESLKSDMHSSKSSRYFESQGDGNTIQDWQLEI